MDHQEAARRLEEYVAEIGERGITAGAARGAADMLARLGRPEEAERLLASACEAPQLPADLAVLRRERLRHARDAAVPYQDAFRLLRFEEALHAAEAALTESHDAEGPLARTLALYGNDRDDDAAAARDALDHAALLIRLDRVGDAAPLLDALWELAEPATVLYARATAQRVLVFLVLEQERQAGHAYAQAAALVARRCGWGPQLAEHLAVVHDELSFAGGERDAHELLEQLHAAAERAGDAGAEAVVGAVLRERAGGASS